MALGVATRTSDYLIMRRHPQLAAPWTEGLESYLISFAVWGLLAALMVAATHRWPVEAPRRVRHAAVHVALAAVFSLVHPLLYIGIRWPTAARPPGARLGEVLETQVFASLLLGLQVYGTVVAVAHLLRYNRALRARAVAQARLETQLAEARLAMLRGQLRPHFLFNTLNSVSALMAHDVPGARRMIARLSDLLRLSLDDDGAPETPLWRELEFLASYVDIQRTRFGDRLAVDYEVYPAARDALVPRLLLQPLVENAIVHGLSPRPGPGRVWVSADRAEGRLRLEVRDDGVGWGAASAGEGVGIGNTRARLRALYGDGQRLLLDDAPGGGARVRVELPFTPATEDAS